jgi:hypothetical protein
MSFSNNLLPGQLQQAIGSNILPLTAKQNNSYYQSPHQSQKRFVPTFVAERSSHNRCNVHFGMLRHCRIKKRESDRYWRAIEYNGKYYSFFKLIHSWTEAEAIAIQLDQDFVITVMTQGWAIWLYRH